MANAEDEKIRIAAEQLADAQKRQKDAEAVVRATDDWKHSWAVDAEVLTLERELAAAKGEEYAEPLDFPVQWDAGVPLPHIMANGDGVPF